MNADTKNQGSRTKKGPERQKLRRAVLLYQWLNKWKETNGADFTDEIVKMAKVPENWLCEYLNINSANISKSRHRKRTFSINALCKLVLFENEFKYGSHHMRYIWKSGRRSRIMHVGTHDPITGKILMKAICGINKIFDRSINAPFTLGNKVCRNCLDHISDASKKG